MGVSLPIPLSAIPILLHNTITALIICLPLLILISPALLLSFILIPSITLLFLYNHYKLAQTSAEQVKNFEGITLAHRGGQPFPLSVEEDGSYLPGHPENSLTAFEWSVKQSDAQGIELDCWLTADDEIVVFHDQYTNRLTNDDKRQSISQLTLKQVKSLQFKQTPKIGAVSSISLKQGDNASGQQSASNKSIKFDSNQSIPSLEEVVEWFLKQPAAFRLMIEVKEIEKRQKMAVKLNQLYTKYPALYERSFVAAFNPLQLYYLRLLNTRIHTAFLVTRSVTWFMQKNAADFNFVLPVWFRYGQLMCLLYDGLMRYVCASVWGLKFMGCRLVCVDQFLLSAELIDYYHNNDITLCSWTVNSKEQKHWLKTRGVTVITDFHVHK